MVKVAAIGFDGSKAVPGQRRGLAAFAYQGPQSGQGRCSDGHEVRAGLEPGIGCRPGQSLDQLVQRALCRFASGPQTQEMD